MKKITATLMAIMLCCFSIIKAQEQQAAPIELKWSEPITYSKKTDGWFQMYIGTNSNQVYSVFSTKIKHGRSKKKKIIAFDKNTMKQTYALEIRGYNKQRDKEVDDMYIREYIVLEDMIYILWQKEEKDVMEIYVESYDSHLKKIRGMKKVYEVSTAKKRAESFGVMRNQEIGNKILFVKEFPNENDDENLKIEYKLMNQDFSFAASGRATLPIVMRKKGSRKGLACTYMLADNGNIYIQDYVDMRKDEKKELKKREASRYPVIMQLKPESGDLQSFNAKFPLKNTFNFKWMVTKNSIKLFGFFCDLDKDAKGNDTHGIFLLTMDEKNFTPKYNNFAYFDKSFLDKLYSDDKENQKKGRGMFKSEKAKQSDNESIDDNYVIEDVQEDGKDIILFCSIMRNWQQTTCTTSSNGGQTCTTRYYCDKGNVTVFRLNEAGNIVWASNLDRFYRYNRWNVYDLSVIKNGNDYVVLYNSVYQIHNLGKKKKKKKAQQMQDRFEYAVFNGQTGNYTQTEYQVNGFNTKKKETKMVNAANIYLYDNAIYTDCIRKSIGHLGTIKAKR